MKKIIIERSPMAGCALCEYKAYLEEDSAIARIGDTESEALAKLIESFPNVFQIRVESRT